MSTENLEANPTDSPGPCRPRHLYEAPLLNCIPEFKALKSVQETRYCKEVTQNGTSLARSSFRILVPPIMACPSWKSFGKRGWSCMPRLKKRCLFFPCRIHIRYRAPLFAKVRIFVSNFGSPWHMAIPWIFISPRLSRYRAYNDLISDPRS